MFKPELRFLLFCLHFGKEDEIYVKRQETEGMYGRMVDSGLSVGQILQTPGLEGIEVLSGRSGLWRQVHSVTIVDAPDASGYIKGGEIILSTLYIWKDNPEELASFIRRVACNGSVAMGIKLKRFYAELPDHIIALSNELEYPIFSYPQHFSFVDIINPVLSRIVNHQADILYRSMEIHKSLTDLSLETGDIGEVIGKIAEIIGTEVAFVDIFSGKTVISGSDPSFAESVKNSSVSDLVSTYRSEEVNVEGTCYGYLLINAHPDPQRTSLLTYNTLMHAQTVLKFRIKRDRLHVQIERRHRDEFILDLLFRNIRSTREVYSRAVLFGWELNRGGFAIVLSLHGYADSRVRVAEDTRERVLRLVRPILNRLFPEVVYTSLTDSLVLLIQSEACDLSDKRQELKRILNDSVRILEEETGCVISCGVGSYVSSLVDISDSFSNARKSMDIARSSVSGNDRVVFWDEKCLYHFINAISDSREGEEFYRSCLSPLYEWDREHNGDFMTTLIAISENGWNLKKTAEKLHLHYNTIKYRFARIREILSLDLDNEEARLNIMLALKIWKIKQNN